MLHGVLATVVNVASTTFILMWNMTFTVACHVFGGKLFGNPRFLGAENSKLKIEKVNTSFTSFAGFKEVT